jgi:AcrR family transcriptional regulator
MTQLAPHPEPGLRERKKRATRLALQRAALHLVAESGLEQVTVEEIAAEADVSPRTFFNYFATKEDALSAVDREAVAESCEALAARPAEEAPLAALRAVFVGRAEQTVIDSEFWRYRAVVAQAYPDLFARVLGASVAADHQIAQVLAARMGVDARTDPRPLLLAGVSSVARRTAMQLWLAGDQRRDLATVLAECFDEISSIAQIA